MNIWYIDYLVNDSLDHIKPLSEFEWKKEAIARKERYDVESTDEDTKAQESRTRTKRITTAMEIRTGKVELLAKYVDVYGKEEALIQLKKDEALVEGRAKAREKSVEKKRKQFRWGN